MQKKPKLPVPSNEDADDEVHLPPPTPIRAMQELGIALGIAPEDLTTSKLMAGPSTPATLEV